MKYQKTFPELLQDGVEGFVIDGEALWEQLDKPQGEFGKWFSRKISSKFVKNSDFISNDKLVGIENTNLKRSKLEVKLTLETAKHLAMSTGMDNNSSNKVREKGKLVRSYFIKMKKVKYSVYQKLITIMMSIVIGCETTKDINEKLGVEKLALNMFDMDTVPDQSQINELIRRFDSDSINQLQDIHHHLFMEHSNSVYSHTGVAVDVTKQV